MNDRPAEEGWLRLSRECRPTVGRRCLTWKTGLVTAAVMRKNGRWETLEGAYMRRPTFWRYCDEETLP